VGDLNTVAFVHQRFAFALLIFAVILGIWGGFQFLRHRAISGGFRSSYLLMIGLLAVQGLLGVVSLTTFRPREILHVVYGIFAIVFLPGVYFYAARGSKVREAAFMAASCWVVAVAFGRGIGTG
jgi:CDP-diglyceride synthetase